MNAEDPETPGFPQILPDEEIKPRGEDDVAAAPAVADKQPTDKELVDAALETLKGVFPRIHQRLVPIWGTAAGEAYLDSLIVDERGNRQGFPADVMRGLLVLQRVHFERFGTFKREDPWEAGLEK
jgi:hypothetical protein